jgi:hypothetical protein
VKHLEVVEKLFEWNQKNLVRDADLQKSDIGHFFAKNFQVRANGRTYQANYDNYFDFLNQFRLTISSIDYRFDDFIVDKFAVAIPMEAKIVRIGGAKEIFEAILILKFDVHDRIVLWHELYMKIHQ